MDSAIPKTSATILPSADVGVPGQANQSTHGVIEQHTDAGLLPTRASKVDGTAGLVKKADNSGLVEEPDVNSDQARSTSLYPEDGDIYSSDSDDGFIPRGYTTSASASKRKTPTAPPKPSGAPATTQSSKSVPTTMPVASKTSPLSANKKTAVPTKRS
ncbi:hypothetical protein GY45DRAFT_1317157 [Cubamyces sp. BRFM 1775]|nr:hypothetical protein GY45DRAFT_1317157 [Cubamyces sp. BRFM 1775]